MARIVRFDAYEVDLAGGQVLKHGKRLVLRDQAFRVLAALVERPGEVVTREELHRRLWPGQVFVDFDNVLNTAVAKLREGLGDSANHPRFIETVPKHGYRFIAAVSEAAAAGGRAPTRRPKVLVLPFLNSTGDPGQEYFSDAMTDEMITALAALAPEELGVIARTTAFHFRGTRKDIARVAREVDVDYVVEGAVRQGNETIAVNLQLIRVSDQAHVWAKRYDLRSGDLFAVQGEIAGTIGRAIGVPLCPAGRPAGRRPTEDIEALTLYRQGRHHALTDFTAAQRCFEQAIARDPHFALAYDALAELSFTFGFMGFAPPKTVDGVGMAYALRALDIDDSLAEIHALLGLFLIVFNYDWPAVMRHMDRARELNPTSPLVRLRYAMGPLLVQGRLEEAIAEMQAALDSDPLSILMRGWLGVMFWLDGQYDRAVEQGRLMVEIEPANYIAHWSRGMFTRERGLFEESIASHRKAVELSGGSMLMLGWLGLALGQAGDVAEARDVLRQLEQAADRHVYVPPTSFAWTYLGLGDVENAFVWLDRAVDASDHMMVPIQLYRFLDPLRGDPRYVALLRKMRLTPSGPRS